jgi:hypothetical protein
VTSKLYLKEARELFPEHDIRQTYFERVQELQQLKDTIDRFNRLYATTAQRMWNAGLTVDTINLERLWITSPLHKEAKDLQSYVYELKEEIVPTGRLTRMDIERARNIPLGTLLGKGKRGAFLCPFHTEKTPSLFVKNNRYKCFGCGKGGDTIGFVMELRKLNFINAVRLLLNYERNEHSPRGNSD